MKKRIGISFTRTRFQNYRDWFTAADLRNDLELVTLSFEANNVDDIHTCNGFVLTGGIDVDPCFYNGATTYANCPDIFEPERDRFEEKIYRHAQAHRLPVLGICRGMQLVNVLEGGTLIQDLGDDGNGIHQYKSADKQHAIRVVKDSLLYDITGEATGHVNSAHHQGVDINILSKKLEAVAYADTAAATIEGIEFKDKKDKGFLLCVQWHPERMMEKEKNPLSQKIKERFIREVKNGKR